LRVAEGAIAIGNHQEEIRIAEEVQEILYERLGDYSEGE
jgi:hypothetical protein